MHKIAALVYKAKLGDGHAWDDAINIWTALFNIPLPSWKVWRKDTWTKWWDELKEWFRGSYSHIELWISDENGNFGGPRTTYPERGMKRTQFAPYLGQCYTSTMRDGMKGTCIRLASKVLKHPERWDVGVISVVTKEEYKRGMFWINRTVENNKGYDKLCIADFFNPLRRWFPIHSKWKQICSEAFQGGVKAFIRSTIADYICSPRRIVRILKKRGVKFGPVREM
jgi:hypothetical protein